jgi:GH18 family chitinase
MGFSTDYADAPEWAPKDTGYHTGERVRYQGHIFIASFWAGEAPGKDPGWAIHDELYDVTATAAAGPSRVIAYIPTWRWREGFDYKNDELYRHITHGIISFLTFSETNLGEFEPEAVADVERIRRDVLSTAHAHGTFISIALGGADDFGFLRLMEEVGAHLSVSGGSPTFTTPQAEQLFNKAAQNVATYVLTHGLDGVDLDLEAWWGKEGNASEDQGGRPKEQGAHPAGYALTAFAARLRQLLPGKIVSAAVFATSWYGNNYDPKLADHVEWLGLMSYDLTGSWNSSPVGPHTALHKVRQPDVYAAEQQGEWPNGPANNPIFSVEDALWYWSGPFYTNWQGAGQRLPRSKLALGVPIYGYDFAHAKDPDDLTGRVPPGYRSIRYRDLLAQFPTAAFAPDANIQVAGSTPRPPFISAPGTYPYAHNIYFETPATAAAKLAFARSVGASGVIIWELSNDVWEAGKSIIQALYQASGNPPVRPRLQELRTEGLRYNQCAFLCTHNSFCNYQDSLWTAPNQSRSIANQLRDGVRALMLDAHYAEPSFLGPIPEPGVYLLHGVNGPFGWVVGATYALPVRGLWEALREVVVFLHENPTEIVTLFLEDYTTTEQLRQELEKVQGVSNLLYDPDNDPLWSTRTKRAWPLVSDLLRWNKRLLIFSSKNHDNPRTKLGVAYDRTYTKQNHWSLGGLGNDVNCRSRWDNDVHLPDSAFLAPPLFVMSHFRDLPTVISAAIDNTYVNLMTRIDSECRPLTGQLPNFVAVDFYEVPPGTDEKAAQVVAELNQRFQAQVLG